MSLLRIGAVDAHLLEMIQKQYEYIDADGDGCITRAEVDAVHNFTKYDVDNSGFLGPYTQRGSHRARGRESPGTGRARR